MEMTPGAIAGSSPWGGPNAGEKTLALAFGGSLTLAYAVVLGVLDGSTAAIASLPLLAAFLLVLASFRIATVFLILSIFISFYVWRYSSAVVFAFPFVLSFLWNVREVEWKWFQNDLTIPIILYGVCALPSLLNASDPLLSTALLVNVVAFLVVFYALAAGIRTPGDLRTMAVVYLLAAVANSLVVIVDFAATGRRTFGYSGIFFVDYAGLAFCVATAMALVSKGKLRLLTFAVSTLLLVAIVVMQTRGIWLVTLTVLAFMGFYALVRPEALGETRRRIAKAVAVGTVVIAAVVLAVVSTNPRIEERATELGAAEEFEAGSLQSGSVPNSVVSRLLIWDTAVNAFLSNPVIGVGVYGFASSSHEYAEIPSVFFRKFVRDLTPHQTFLAVLAETGIVGAVGFAIFFVALIRGAFRSIRKARQEQGKRHAFVCAIAVIYCAASMFVTDAWLWGQQIVLLAIVSGAMVANGKLTASHEIPARP